MAQRKLPDNEIVKLIELIYDCLYIHCESFELQRIGADGMYLVGAISKGSMCTWPDSRPIIQLLRKQFAPEHVVWQFICVDREG